MRLAFILITIFCSQVFAAPPPILILSHARFVGPAPAMGACGTNPSIVGNDSAGAITVGTGGVATSCAITFASTWTTAPHCFVSNETQIVAMKVVPAATTLTITVGSAFSASSVLDYFCVNHQ